MFRKNFISLKSLIQLLISAAIFISVCQESAAQSYSGNDLHYFGISQISDTTAWRQIKNDDLYYLAKVLYEKKNSKLKFIKDDDLYFLAKALVSKNKSELEKIKTDDLYFLGTALFQENSDFLTNIQNDDLYFLGKGLIDKNKETLNKISH